jgi:hypothetical protein
MIVHGTVGSGQHLAARWLADPMFEQLLGAPIYPGSINVFVRRDEHPAVGTSPHPLFRAEQDESVFPGDIRQQGFFLFRECTLNGEPAFLLRTESPGEAYSGPGLVIATPISQPNVMFEIVATRLIEGIAYGVEVTVDLDESEGALHRVQIG